MCLTFDIRAFSARYLGGDGAAPSPPSLQFLLLRKQDVLVSAERSVLVLFER